MFALSIQLYPISPLLVYTVDHTRPSHIRDRGPGYGYSIIIPDIVHTRPSHVVPVSDCGPAPVLRRMQCRVSARDPRQQLLPAGPVPQEVRADQGQGDV